MSNTIVYQRYVSPVDRNGNRSRLLLTYELIDGRAVPYKAVSYSYSRPGSSDWVEIPEIPVSAAFIRAEIKQWKSAGLHTLAN
jgi:hypothetical protein